MSMDPKCYEQLKNDEKARLQLWFELSSEIVSHELWQTLDNEAKEPIEQIIRYVVVEGWND